MVAIPTEVCGRIPRIDRFDSGLPVKMALVAHLPSPLSGDLLNRILSAPALLAATLIGEFLTYVLVPALFSLLLRRTSGV